MSSETEVPRLQPGTRFNNYQVERLLGAGGMGAAFLARDLVLGRPVVVKVMLGSAAEDPTLLERFRREAQAGALIESDNVVKVFEAGRVSGAPLLPIHGKPFIAMQYVDGAPIDLVAKNNGRLPADLAAAIVLGMARGLAAAHAAGIVHRDVKPGNALLTRDGRVKLVDLGLAKFVKGIGGGPPPPDLTRAGTTVGTATYIAPEQAQGGAVDGRADIYALGITFYELLAGTPPFVGANYVEVVTARFTESPRPLRELLPTLPAGLATVCHAFLESDPGRRPTAIDAIAMLQRLVPQDLSQGLAKLFADPARSTEAELAATFARSYGLERGAEPTTQADIVSAAATTRELPRPRTGAAQGRSSGVLPAALFALGSFFLGTAAIVVALIVTRSPQQAVTSPPAAPAPTAPVAPPPTRETAPSLVKEAIASRSASRVRAAAEALRAAPAFDGSGALIDAARDAEVLFGLFEAKTRGLQPALPLDKLLEALLSDADTKGRSIDDDVRATATLLAAIAGQTVPRALLLRADATGGTAERLKRVFGALGLERPATF